MKKLVMSESAYIIVGDLANVHQAQNALRQICQSNSEDYISKEDYEKVMGILSKWSKEMFKRIETTEGEAQQSVQPNLPNVLVHGTVTENRQSG